MTSSGRFAVKSTLIGKVALLTMLMLAAGSLLSLGYDLKQLLQQGLELVRSAGPTMFFLSMAVLPAAGAPLSFFTLTAGSVFGPQLGMPLVLALSLVSITVNMVLGYLLANRVLRPPMQSLLTRLGYKVPQLDSGDASDLIVLLRATPGMPFPVQNYLLGLAATPFSRYLVVSCLIVFPINTAIVFFGEALLQGKGRLALLALLLLLMLMSATHLLWKHYGAKALPSSADTLRTGTPNRTSGPCQEPP
jgi:uncharacterized membrane protein YdjX (TVP38/TMEM64 family)